ncbi:HipA N-terminal domain-containing protein [Agarivorans sp. 3_MG-2023]|nr:HipA N-terminal domain-containing protein [Agarivorans sp. 3_MG-2023]MDO6686639.1 HipA N-terminal domain-containing protein [Agarivorans sp. 3_MG-2023]MDO6717736.1 HipA N-terminal domain-containing protein [Agarivorans sp. 2_MG-2023]
MYGGLAGVLTESDEGFTFEYVEHYQGQAVSFSLPVRKKRFSSPTLFPYFKGLAPEGWLLEQYSKLQHIDERDQLGMLIANGKDLIGAVTLERAVK